MVNEKKLVSQTVRNYAYLMNLNGELKQIIRDSKKHAHSAKVDKILSSVTKIG